MLAMPDYPYAIFPDPEHLPQLPESLLSDGRNYLERLQQRASPEDFAVFAARPELLYVLSMSEFVAKTIIQYPEECAQLVRLGFLDQGYLSYDATDAINSEIVVGLPEAELKRRLRVLRRHADEARIPRQVRRRKRARAVRGNVGAELRGGQDSVFASRRARRRGKSGAFDRNERGESLFRRIFGKQTGRHGAAAGVAGADKQNRPHCLTPLHRTRFCRRSRRFSGAPLRRRRFPFPARQSARPAAPPPAALRQSARRAPAKSALRAGPLLSSGGRRAPWQS